MERAQETARLPIRASGIIEVLTDERERSFDAARGMTHEELEKIISIYSQAANV
jgi:broad specificity phosphatase PhoE